MSRPSSASTNSANAFPRQAGATLLVPELPVGDQSSPSPPSRSRSTFSFEDSPKSVQGTDNPIDAIDATLVRPVSRGAVGERKSPLAPPVHRPVPRKRAQYYEEQFAYKEDSTSSARERITKDSPIIAELRTNVIIKDEYTLVTDLSHHLSTRYQRPESSIMITVDHSACLLLGGSFEPTYILSITALPVQLQPTLNKRNAAMIQAFMSESIGVPLERGVLKFVAIPDDSLATNGTTILGEIDRIERQQAEENGSGLKRALTKSSRRSAVFKSKSSMQLSRNDSKAANGGVRAVITPPFPSPGPFDSGVAVDKGTDQLSPLQPIESLHAWKNSMGRAPSKRPSTDKFGPKTRASDLAPRIVTLSVPGEDGSKPRIGKRKSFMTIFRR
ncbi:hypothetical protein K504DRAFT_367914 [Pleomassaria siparia CBS 279.74]|uniref:L-dopachrome isomerase n=1 Tax=Pleomassaria siparia CBS 279.74 TaxID=1314801 RepID=A0A6G1KS99_9PLEO|nr:hypothetical protein K504DRAFT_367914 [Pleomassaria siparia CBS 279.74]